MDIENLYDDLPEFDLGVSVKQIEDENAKLKQHIISLENELATMTKKLAEMKETQENLERNLSELFKTAKAEIQRKDRTISELRSELDRVLFNKNRKRGRENSPPSLNNVQKEELSKRFKPDSGYEKQSICKSTDDRHRHREAEKDRPRSRDHYRSKDEKRHRSRSRDSKNHHRHSENHRKSQDVHYDKNREKPRNTQFNSSQPKDKICILENLVIVKGQGEKKEKPTESVTKQPELNSSKHMSTNKNPPEKDNLFKPDVKVVKSSKKTISTKNKSKIEEVSKILIEKHEKLKEKAVILPTKGKDDVTTNTTDKKELLDNSIKKSGDAQIIANGKKKNKEHSKNKNEMKSPTIPNNNNTFALGNLDITKPEPQEISDNNNKKTLIKCDNPKTDDLSKQTISADKTVNDSKQSPSDESNIAIKSVQSEIIDVEKPDVVVSEPNPKENEQIVPITKEEVAKNREKMTDFLARFETFLDVSKTVPEQILEPSPSEGLFESPIKTIIPETITISSDSIDINNVESTVEIVEESTNINKIENKNDVVEKSPIISKELVVSLVNVELSNPEITSNKINNETKTETILEMVPTEEPESRRKYYKRTRSPKKAVYYNVITDDDLENFKMTTKPENPKTYLNKTTLVNRKPKLELAETDPVDSAETNKKAKRKKQKKLTQPETITDKPKSPVKTEENKPNLEPIDVKPKRPRKKSESPFKTDENKPNLEPVDVKPKRPRKKSESPFKTDENKQNLEPVDVKPKRARRKSESPVKEPKKPEEGRVLRSSTRNKIEQNLETPGMQEELNNKLKLKLSPISDTTLEKSDSIHLNLSSSLSEETLNKSMDGTFSQMTLTENASTPVKNSILLEDLNTSSLTQENGVADASSASSCNNVQNTSVGKSKKRKRCVLKMLD